MNSDLKNNPTTSEFHWIEEMVESTLKPYPNTLLIPPGDDCAEIQLTESRLLFAADMLMEGVHFDLKETKPFLVGSKAVKVNLSDIAAMAGSPTSITISLALPKKEGASLGHEVMAGAAAAAREYGVSIAGGDTNSWEGPLVVSVAIIGTPHPLGSVSRGGARPGDWIFVTGPLGGSYGGRRHLTFAPRLALAQSLHHFYHLTSMLDLSDGVGSDLRHILKQSRVGATLDPEHIPIHPDVFKSPDRQPSGVESSSPLTHALSDGEDFELCFTVNPRDGERLVQDLLLLRESRVPPGTLALGRDSFDPELWLNITKIGDINPDQETLTWRDGQLVTNFGYRHSLG